DAAAQLALGRLAVQDPPAVEHAHPAHHANLARALVHAHFAELRAVRAHRETIGLARLGGGALRLHLVEPGSAQDRREAFAVLEHVGAVKTAVARHHFAESEAR